MLEQEKFNGLKTYIKNLIVGQKYTTPQLVGFVYDLYQDYLISEEQELELYSLVDPYEDYNDCGGYWNEWIGENPLAEYLGKY